MLIFCTKILHIIYYSTYIQKLQLYLHDGLQARWFIFNIINKTKGHRLVSFCFGSSSWTRTTSVCGARHSSLAINRLAVCRPRHNPPRSLFPPPAAFAARFPASAWRLAGSLVHFQYNKQNKKTPFGVLLFWLLKPNSNQRPLRSKI